MTKVNVPLLNEVLDIVREAAKHNLWDQSVWLTQEFDERPTGMTYKGQEFCGTAGCFAGWTVMLDGWKPVPAGWDEIAIVKSDRKHSSHHASSIAKDLLGLSEEQAAALFEGSNTMEMLEEIVEKITMNPDDAYIHTYENEDDE